MRFLSWNINRASSGRLDNIVSVLNRQSLDVLALQEVSATQAYRLQRELLKIGFPYSGHSQQHKSGRESLAYGVLIASRWPLRALPIGNEDKLPFLESVLSVLVNSPLGAVEVHSAHIPNGSTYKWKKIETFEWVYERLKNRCETHRILCGDFNAPQRENKNGEVVTHGQNFDPRTNQAWIRRQMDGGSGERFHYGEYNVLKGLEPHDLADAYRSVNGYKSVNNIEDKGYSYCTVRNSSEQRFRRRFDHVLASRSLNPVKAEYLLDHLENRLSDHAPIVVNFEPVDLSCQRPFRNDGH